MRSLQPPFVELVTKLVQNRSTTINTQRNSLFFTGILFMLNGGLNVVMATSGSLRMWHAVMALLMIAGALLMFFRARRLDTKREAVL